MRAAISRAYYGVYFEVRDTLIASGINAAWGRHEAIVDFLKQRAPDAVPAAKAKEVTLLCEKLGEMRRRRGDADYILTLEKKGIVDRLGRQIHDGNLIQPTAAETARIIAASALGKALWPNG